MIRFRKSFILSFYLLLALNVHSVEAVPVARAIQLARQCAARFGSDGRERIQQREIESWRRMQSQPAYLTEKKFGTTIYSLAASDTFPQARELPTRSKALVIAFGGSGSVRGNGSAFMRNATSLA